MTAINYATEWSVAKAIKNATEEKLAWFIYNNIYVNYDTPREILLNNRTNLLAEAVRYYVNLLKACHHMIISYYSRTNRKIENLNDLINHMLIKYLMSKSTRL